jgi:hypothetical protein
MRISAREPEDEALAVAARPPAGVAPVPAAVLRMQATAGNRATRDLLARDPVQAKPKALYTMTIAKHGAFPLLAFALGNSERDDIRVTLALSDGARLQGAALTDSFRTVTITGPTLTITLTDVVISNYSVSGGTGGQDAVVDLALNAQKREFK